MRAVEGPFPFEGDLTLSNADERNTVTNTIETGSDGRFTTIVFTLFRLLMRRLMVRRLRAELIELNRVLETTTDGSGEGKTTDCESSIAR